MSDDKRLDWLDPVKALALFAILLNHLVEEFGPGPFFTNPGADWPSPLHWRELVPHGMFALAPVRALGWLGDSAPGVFILASGLGLALSTRVVPARQFWARRARRIYPLYVAMHFVLLGAALVVPGVGLVFGRAAVLSLLGFRGTHALFFYLNPAWWFVWLILQLYLLYPLLAWLRRRWGDARFLAATLALTFVVRAVVLWRAGDPYDWLTGMCALTRLGEFTVGMVLAGRALPSTRRLALAGAALYLAGLGSSFLYWGAIVSNLLVTLGMTAIFCALWQRLKRFPRVARRLTAIGVGSFGVYLLHQTPLIWTDAIRSPPLHLSAALAVLAASFPLAAAIERGVERLQAEVARVVAAGAAGRLGAALALVGVGALAGGQLASHARPFAWLAGLCLVGVVWLALEAGRGRALLVAVGAAALAVVAGELALRTWAPLELASSWGELPALTSHPTRVYALRPNQNTHLKYNNYDYWVRTNADGLPGPAVELARRSDGLRILAIGDAFTMPEGLNYENGYPAILQTVLSARLHAPVEVIDAGVTGYGPVEESAQLAELLPRYRPDVVVYQFFINEFEEASIAPDELRRDIGLVRERQSRLKRLVEDSQLQARLRWLAERARERLTGRPGAWRAERALLGFLRAGDNVYYDAAHVEAVRARLEQMQQAAQAAGARLVVFYVPPAVMVSRPGDLDYFPAGTRLDDRARFDLDRPLERLRALAEPLGLPVVDLTPALRGAPEQPVYFPASWHWNQAGHRVAAAAIADALVVGGWLPAAHAPPR